MNAPLVADTLERPARASPYPDVVVDAELIRKYGGNGPRYTSYPTADRFVEAFGPTAYRHWLRNRNVGGFARPLALYVHLPFCDTICYYCACNKVVTRVRDNASTYLTHLAHEIALVSGTLGGDRAVSQMHWGGGTPTFFADEQLEALMKALRAAFSINDAAECAIELDPRKVDAKRIGFLARLGFNRVSLGVQDFDPAVQAAVNRIQTVEQTMDVVRAARANGFRSLNLDLIYGLPKQTVAGFSRTLDRVIECNPDRIALYSYAHLPTVFKPQRRILSADLPAPEVKLEIMTTAIARLQQAGYLYIGMDHFARPGDDLAVAQREGRLTRNFQGYSASGDADIVGLGVSAIGKVGPAYAQNAKTLDDYYARLNAGELPIQRGVELSADDIVRRAVIQSLACHFRVSREGISIGHLIDFDRYFASELEQLAVMEREGLVTLDEEWITVTNEGRLLVRAVCMVFDKYLKAERARAQYSRVL